MTETVIRYSSEWMCFYDASRRRRAPRVPHGPAVGARPLRSPQPAALRRRLRSCVIVDHATGRRGGRFRNLRPLRFSSVLAPNRHSYNTVAADCSQVSPRVKRFPPQSHIWSDSCLRDDSVRPEFSGCCAASRARSTPELAPSANPSQSGRRWIWGSDVSYFDGDDHGWFKEDEVDRSSRQHGHVDRT